MKILAPIPTKKTANARWFTFDNEWIEVEVVRVIRYKCDRTRPRYHYQADVTIPPQLHPDAPNFMRGEGLYRVIVDRRLNPKWKPPAFPAGVAAVMTTYYLPKVPS